jgi:transcription initiation factor TFIID subunit 2
MLGKVALKTRLDWSHYVKKEEIPKKVVDTPKVVAVRKIVPQPSNTQVVIEPSSLNSPCPQEPAAEPLYKIFKKILRKLCTHSSAAPFLRPVDPVLDGVPNYLDVIRHPMDLSTIRRKVDSSEYKSIDDFKRDVEQMLQNCFTYNQENTPVYKEGKALEKAFLSLLKRKIKPLTEDGSSVSTSEHSVSVVPTVTLHLDKKAATPIPKVIKVSKPVAAPKEILPKRSAELLILDDLIEKMKNHVSSSPFLYPVDPVALNIPNYFDIIQKPMDLKTIEVRLNNGTYTSRNQFRDDVLLMLNNCYSFNLEDSWVFQQGKKLQHFFEKEWSALFGETVTGFYDGHHPPPVAPPVAVIVPTTPVKSGLLIPAHELQACDKVLSSMIIQSAEFLSIHEKVRKMKGKLHDNRYKTVDDLKQDLLSMLSKKETQGTQKLRELLEVLWVEHSLGNQDKELSPITTDSIPWKQMNDIHQKLVRHKSSFYFRLPVTAADAPNYFDIIKSPMDLKTVGEKLASQSYSDFKGFVSDIKLIFANCYSYNIPGTIGYEEGKQLETFFDRTVKGVAKGDDPTKKSVVDPMKECDRILKKLFNRKESFIFHEPVDAVGLGIPHYHDIIKQPMDFGTIRSKLKGQQYQTPSQFESDVRLVFQNCRIFNPPDSSYYRSANVLEQVFDKDWLAAFPDSNSNMSPVLKQIKDQCRKVLDALKAHECAYPFLIPVDPVKLGIPHYFDVIKQPMDLSTIEKKLAGDYTLQQLEDDVKLIFHNCYTFNPPDSEVYVYAQRLEEEFKRLISQATCGTPSSQPSNKRKETEKPRKDRSTTKKKKTDKKAFPHGEEDSDTGKPLKVKLKLGK